MKEKIKNIYPGIVMLFQFILYYFIFVKNNIIFFDSLSSYLMCFITIVNAYYFSNKLKATKNSIYFSKWYWILLFIILNLIISFFVSGKQLFLSTESAIIINFKNLLIYLLVNLYIFPYICNGLNFLDNFKLNLEKKKRSKKEKIITWISVFLIIAITWIIASSGFYPANMTSDSVDQWAQALGVVPIYASHPPLLAILMRGLSYIWESPFVVIVFNICFFASVFASITTYLYKKGLKYKTIIIITILFTLSINNISLVTILWKDIPFTISFMWLTFELYKIYDQKELYFKNKFNCISLITAMILVNLIRSNGLIQLITVFLILIYLIFKYKSKYIRIIILIIMISTVGINWFITNTIYDLFEVKSVKGGGTPATYMFMARGLGAVAHYTDDISDETMETLEKILPFEKLREKYNAYNGDTYGFGEDNWGKNLQKIEPNEVYTAFFRECLANSRIIIRDRLDSNNILWSMVTPSDGFNSTYITDIWFPKAISAESIGLEYTNEEEMVYSKGNSALRTNFENYRSIFESNTILYIVFWRPAFALSILLIVCYNLLVKKSNLLLITLPTITGIMFWTLFLVHQSYRYLWFIYINLFLIMLFYLFEKSKIKNKISKKKVKSKTSSH